MSRNSFYEKDAVKRVYPNKQWAMRVNAMEEDQIIAIFYRLRNQGKIE